MRDILMTTTAAVAIAALSATAATAAPLTTPEELNAMLADGDLAIIDIRSRVELDAKVKELPAELDYAQGHIPGAVKADYRSAGWRGSVGQEKYVLPQPAAIQALIRGLGVDAEDTVVIVAGGTSPKALDLGAATRVYWTFKALGHEDVTILDGGYDAWVAAGLPVSTEAVAPEPGNFTADPQAAMLKTGANVELAIQDAVEVIDARPTAQFTGQAKPGSSKNPGTIPTAMSVPAGSVVAADGKGFADREKLAAMFDAAGLTEGEEGIAFCNTGHYATVTWFAASEILGRDVEVYDGSMFDWTFLRNGPTVVGTVPGTDG